MTATGLVWVEPSKTTAEGLATLIDALSTRVKAIEDDYITETKLTNAIKTNEEVVNAKNRADDAYELAEGKVDSETYATDKTSAKEDRDDIREIAEGVRDAFDTFMNSEEVKDTVDTLKEIQVELEKMTDATELTTALAGKADIDYVDTAKSEAISEAASAASALYATQTRVNELETALDERLDTLESINHNLYATKEEVEAHKTTAESTYATKEELKATDDKTTSNTNAISNLTGRLDGIVAQGGEPNVINNIKVNGVVQTITDKAVDITVPTQFSDLADNSGFGARIDAAQAQADAGVNAANAAQQTADEAKQTANENATTIGELTTTVAGHTETINGHASRLTALENADTAHKAEYEALKGIVDGHTATIAGKADIATLEVVSAKASANEAIIKTINETTIPGINAEIAKKANLTVLDDYYKKTEIDSITGKVAEGKTLVKMIEDAQTAATYDDTEIRALIDAEKSRIDNVLANTDEEALNSIAELADWVNTHGTKAEGMVSAIEKNATDIISLTSRIDNLTTKVDDKTIKTNENGEIYVHEVSTDSLVQGEMTLILNGGSATVE